MKHGKMHHMEIHPTDDGDRADYQFKSEHF